MFTPSNYLDNKLPKPFDKLKVKEEEEILIERYGGKESLSPGTRVVKGPGYNQRKRNAVEGNYIGTILRNKLEEKVQTRANVKEKAAEEGGNTTSETEDALAKTESENPTNNENVSSGKSEEKIQTSSVIQEKNEEESERSTTDTNDAQAKTERISVSSGEDTNNIENVPENNREPEDLEIYWDNGKKDLCAIGPELQLYDSNLIREDDTQCDGCQDYPLKGIRWTCITCNTTNLCTSCYMADKENSHHIYKRLVTKGLTGLEMPSRSNSVKNGKRKEVHGITLGSKVTLPNDNMQGTVMEFVKANVCRYIFRDGKGKEIDPKTIQKRYDDAKKIKIPPLEGLLPKLTKEMVERLHEIRVIKRLKCNDKNKEKDYIAGTVVSFKRTDGDKSNLMIKIHWDARRNLDKKRFFNVSNSEDDENDAKDHNTLYLFGHGCLQSEECTECKNGALSFQADATECSSDCHFTRSLWKCNECAKGGCSLCYITNKHGCDGTLECSFNGFTGKPGDKSKDANLYIFKKGDKINGINSQDRQYLCLVSSNQPEVPEVQIHETSFILPILVKNQNDEVFLRDISEMKVLKSKNNDKASVFSYQDHLPVLGDDEVVHYVANIETGTKQQKIQVQVWQNGSSDKKETKSRTSQTFRPSLYYILNDDNNQRHEYQDVISSLCHFVNEKILIGKKLVGEYQTCCVHKSTTAEIVKELVEEGCTVFKLRDIKNKDDGSQIEYFKQMAEGIMGEKMMPVFITLTGLTRQKLQEAAKNAIPLIYLKKSFVYVLWNGLECEADSLGNIFQVNFQQPWIITRMDSDKVFLSPPYKGEKYVDSHQNSEDFDLRIALILTGVIMHMLKEKAHKPRQGKDISVRLMEQIPLYMTSLPVQVLKAGRWNFPGSYVMETLDKIFDQNSIQYIFEKNMEEEFKNGMWEDLKETTESAYLPPNLTVTRPPSCMRILACIGHSYNPTSLRNTPSEISFQSILSFCQQLHLLSISFYPQF